MRIAWHEIWGCARGPATSLTPQARIVVGTGLFTASLLAPVATWPGAAFASVVSLSWLALCWPPVRAVRAVFLVGLSALVSSLLLLPFAVNSSQVRPEASGLSTYLGLLAGGASALITSVSTVTALSMSDLRAGLLRLPVPAGVSAILLQIVHQTSTLAHETRRVASAMAVRGALSKRTSGVKLLASLPRVWLPRVIQRADRVASAMELRGYCDGGTNTRADSGLARADAVAIALAAGAVVLSAVLRYRSFR
jgi:cobalt/nickel transport system permease protein